MGLGSERLSEEIGYLIVGRDVAERDVASCHLLEEVVEVLHQMVGF